MTISVAFIYICINVFVFLISERLLFPYHQSSYTNELPGLKMLKSSDGTEIASRLFQSRSNEKLVLYFHGNYLDIGNLDEIAQKFTVHDYSLWAIDYRGYGLSEGVATEKNAYTDAILLYNTALRNGYKADNISIVGRSVGTGVATELARLVEAKALVLISPFTSAYRVMTKYSLFSFDRFNNSAKIHQISEPLLLLHGAKDELIPSWHSLELFGKHHGVQQIHLSEGAGHNDVYDFDVSIIFDFLKPLIST